MTRVADARLVAAAYLFALLTLLINDHLLKRGPQTSMTIGLRTDTTDPERDVSLLGTVHETDGGVTIELETIDIIRQTTPIEVDPYVVEATRRIRKCLGAENQQ